MQLANLSFKVIKRSIYDYEQQDFKSYIILFVRVIRDH
jgi:hypothetical protein